MRFSIQASRAGPDGRSPAALAAVVPRDAAVAMVHLVMTVALVLCIIIAATALSIGGAFAQSPSRVSDPDAGLVMMLMIGAIAVMCALSAIAVRFTGRTRHHAK